MRFDRPILLENSLKHYAWGSTDAIPKLIGQTPDGKPWAELWIGAHSQMPSRAGGVPLDRLIAEHPEEILGPDGGLELPFLLKILAARTPLSVQCHPDAEQARIGFAREEQEGIPRDAPHRSYRDPNPKPEMVVALSRFHVLKGFRPPAEICAQFGKGPHPGLEAAVKALGQSGDLKAFIGALLNLPQPARAPLVKAAAAAHQGTVALIAATYPSDVFALAPLFLHELILEPGQGLFLGARELHSYLSGTALEIMGNSDNVLRCGLTEKHIDVAELLRVVSFQPSTNDLLMPVKTNLRMYENPSDCCFRLSKVEPPTARTSRTGPDLLLCLGGNARIECSAGTLELTPGQSALVPHCAGDYKISGDGELWLASTP